MGVAAVIASAALMALTPQQKAALVVVSGLPAPAGVGGVLVQRWNQDAPRPAGALAFADQEGGGVRAFPSLAPAKSARGTRSKAEAYELGRATASALRRRGVGVDLAPVLDLPDGPLGARQYTSPFFGVAFARGLAAGRVAACVKHFPGLGTLPVSTDDRPYVRGRLRDVDLAPYRAAVEADVPCVMVGHGVYAALGGRRAVLEPATYRLLRSLGFQGVAITDSLSVVHGRAAPWAVGAARAGADLLLFTSPTDAARAIRALVPLARRGLLDGHVARVLRFRSAFD
ncbi:MAG: glycoside hydrolase family 3 N-terminal domain-containing protein [Gaiellaceae bacterium]